MRSFYARSVALTLGVLCLAGSGQAQNWGAQKTSYPVTQASAIDTLWANEGVDVQPPAPPSKGDVISEDYKNAMQAPYEGCTTCDSGCGNGKYIFANALIMTHDKRGGFVTSIDSTSGDPELLFCQPEYGNLWHGGFEIGGGYCFNCGQNAIEASYWGLYPSEGTITARGNLDSMIDFADLDYDGGDGNAYFDGSRAHRVAFEQEFHSFEVNLLGNSCQGGPFGCGMCGCCSPYGCNARRLGFGWIAGLRYINFTEDWMFSCDTDDTRFDNSRSELNYEVDLENHLFGFQLGGGINYCVTERLTAYATSKFGVYGNQIDMRQEIYGRNGRVTINNGDFAGDNCVIEGSDTDLAFAGQFDLGGRWAINQRLSVNFGYRLLGLTGVAVTEDNVAQGNFQNVLGIADVQTGGSLLLHGGFAGLTYCW